MPTIRNIVVTLYLLVTIGTGYAFTSYTSCGQVVPSSECAPAPDVTILAPNPASPVRRGGPQRVTEPLQPRTRDLRAADYVRGANPRSHQILLDDTNGFRGRISLLGDDGVRIPPIGPLTVELLRNGEWIAGTQTNHDGEFQLTGLCPGSCAFVSHGQNCITAFAVHIHKIDDGPEYADEEVIQIDTAAVPPENFELAMAIIRNYMSANARPTVTRESAPQQIPETLRPIEQRGVPGTSLADHSVQLTPDGRLVGRLRRLQRQTGRRIAASSVNVLFLRDNQVVAGAVTDANGVFSVGGLSSGNYSFIAAGGLSDSPPEQQPFDFSPLISAGTLRSSRSVSASENGIHEGFLAGSLAVTETAPRRGSENLGSPLRTVSLLVGPDGDPGPDPDFEFDAAMIGLQDFYLFAHQLGIGPTTVPATAAPPAAPGSGTTGSSGTAGQAIDPLAAALGLPFWLQQQQPPAAVPATPFDL